MSPPTFVSSIMIIGFMAAMAGAPYTKAEAVPCDEQSRLLQLCHPYIKREAPLNQTCCDGVAFIYSRAQTPEEKMFTCNCFQRLIADDEEISASDRTYELPQDCNITPSFVFDQNTNCTQIN